MFFTMTSGKQLREVNFPNTFTESVMFSSLFAAQPPKTATFFGVASCRTKHRTTEEPATGGTNKCASHDVTKGEIKGERCWAAA